MIRLFTKNKIIIFVLVLVSLKTIAQIPVNDPAWVIQTSKSEEFNTPPILFNSTSTWINHYGWGVFSGYTAEYNDPANLIETGTTLKIKADTLCTSHLWSPSIYNTTSSAGVTVVHQGGAFFGRNPNYKFGFLEIYAQLPSSGCFPLWPAFWLWDEDCSSLMYDEIDICEMGPDESFTDHSMITSIWLYNSGSCPHTNHIGYPEIINDLPTLCSVYHKYAVEWAPDRVIWYLDDSPIRTLFDPTGLEIPQHAMRVILNFAINIKRAWLPPDWNNTHYLSGHGNSIPTCFSNSCLTPTPKYFEIDYLRYYQLNTDCSNNLTICTPGSDYSTRAVEKTISTGGSCSATFNTSDSYTLRATDYILLDAGTTINPNSSGFFAIQPMACPQ